MSITIKNLTKKYGSQTAVNKLSLTLKKGEIVGFLGPNGAGKSTTMKIITGYLLPDDGQVTLDGLDVVSHPLEAKKKIGYLPESNALYYDMFVREYLSFIADLHSLNHKKEAIEKVIATVGLGNESSKKIGQLSKGYKQRVGLAAALIHDPEVLVLDEPTTGLDPNQILEIREVIRQLGKEKTILFSSHILQEVEALCSRVVVINKGELVADSPLKDLLQKQSSLELMVRFKENIEHHLFEGLGELLNQHPQGFSLQTEDPDGARKKVWEIAQLAGLNIVSLSEQNKNSLEEIFRDLTKN